MTGMTEDAIARASKLSKFLGSCRELDADLTISQLEALLRIAAGQPMPQSDLDKALGLQQGSTSRVVSVLTEHGRRGREGLRLVVAKVDPMDRRINLLSLTPQGRAVVQQLLQGLGQL